MRIFALVMTMVFVILPINAVVGATHQIVKTVNGRAITFEAPPSMCVFDPEYPSDKEYLDFMAEENKPDNTLVLVFTVCSELEKSRTSSNTVMSNYEVILFPSGIGKNSTIARQDFLSEMRTFFDADKEFLPGDVVEQVREKVAAANEAKIGQVNSLGVLLSTDEALVIGLTSVVEFVGEKPAVIASVIAMTALNGVPLTVNLHRNPYEDETTITGLVDRVQAHVKTLVAANADVATSKGGASIDWSQVFQKALIGGLIGLVLAVGFAMVKAMRKRKT